MLKDNTPTFEVTIDDAYSEGENLGIDLISYVKNPAVIIKGHAFSRVDKKKLEFADTKKYRIAAPALVPGDIYRNDEEGEYYLRFTEQKIEQLAKKFMKNLTSRKNGVFNLEHSNEMIDSYILESILADSDAKVKMIAEEYGVKVPKGTFFLVSQFNNKQMFEDIVANDQIGYSIEGFLGMELADYFDKNKKQLNKNEMNKNSKPTKMSEGGVSGYMQLPAGTHTIAGMVYTVEEVIENEGQDNEWKTTKIVSMVPAGGEAAAPAEGEAPVAAKKEKMSDAPVDETKKEDVPAEGEKKEAMADAPVDEKKPEDSTKPADSTEKPVDETKKEDMAEGDAPAADASNPDASGDAAGSYTKAEVDEKIDAIYKALADMQEKIDGGVVPTEEGTTDTAMRKQNMSNVLGSFFKFQNEREK